MLLRSIQVQGFKSFADKTVLKFGKGITAVVGPNGSGKSNISDAVRWVLGEQSTKNLRGQSMEDVIFGGTALRRPHGFCEVTLNIDNSDRSLNFDDDAVSITRRYYRSHESEYLINNVSVRLKDINELFMDTGLGRDGYSMIGQGKIDNIISSKSQERRDIFEEAAGISKYRYRKTEAERKLLAAEDNLLRLRDIMSELEGRINPLKEQSEKATRFLALAEQKKTLEIGLWLYTLNNSKQALRAQEDKINLAQIKYNDIDRELATFDERAEQNTHDFAGFTAAIDEERRKISHFSEEIVRLEGEISVMENTIDHQSESIERLKCEIDTLKSNDDTANKEIEFKNQVIADKKQLEEKLSLQLTMREHELSDLLTNSESISREIEVLSSKLNEASIRSADLRVAMMTASGSADEIRSRQEVVAASLRDKAGEKALLDEELNHNNEYLATLEETISDCRNSLNGYELLKNTRVEKVQALKDECESLRLDCEAKKRRVQILSELEKNLEGFNRSVKSVMNASGKGILRGIRGPVSKIITVSKEYSVAVETALGATIQQIVCDTEENAKRAIEMLKNTGDGRATFLPVSSIRARDFTENGFENMPGYIGMAPSLIQCEDEYREIVRYLLGNTVVCEDLDSAVAISRKFGYRLKTVSLDGQVVNSGGSLTGGSLMKNAGILSRASDIKRLSEEIERQSEKLSKSDEALTKASAELAKIDADINAANAALTTANEDKIRVLGELKRVTDILDALHKGIDELNAESTASEAKIAELTSVATSYRSQIGILDSQRQSIQSEIDKKTGGRASLSDTRDTISAQITADRMEMLEVKKDIENLYASVTSLSDVIEKRLKRTEMLDGEIALLVDAQNDSRQKICNIQKTIEEQKALSRKSEEQIETLTGQRAEVEQAGIALRAGEKEQTLEREKIGGELARLAERKLVMAAEYDDVVRRLYDEYQLTRSEAEETGLTVEKPTEAKKELAEVKGKIRVLGNVNVSAIEEYKEVAERYEFLSGQIADVEKSKTELHHLISQLTSQMQELFVVGFDRINDNFAVTFRELFGGGSAKLLLSDPSDILESGIDIDVSLPGKTVPSLDGLSGGEKALIALSIYFAIMRVNAPPFCFLDEVDTALDDINVERVADYMKRPDFSTQFICVTHRRGTMEAADMIYGVTMQEKGITKLIELNVSELEKKMNLNGETANGSVQ